MPSRNEGLIPSLQRQVRTAVADAGDTAGDFLAAQGRSVQALARTTSGRIPFTPSPSTSKPSNTRPSTTTTTTTNKNINNTHNRVAATTNRAATSSRARVDGAGRALGGRLGDWANGVKDLTGATGERASTVANPLGLRGKRAL